MVLALAQPAAANPIVIDFEDQPDSFGNQLFPTSYQGVSWTAGHWLHYAPYEPNGYDPDGVNAIYAASVAGGNSFTFTDAVFAGASLSAATRSIWARSILSRWSALAAERSRRAHVGSM